MNCKKCGALVDSKSNFCPYCGENLGLEKGGSTYQDPFASYREQPTHQEQYQYQQAYSNTNSNTKNRIQYKDDIKKEVNNSKDNKCLIGLILAILAVPLCFLNIGIGIAATVIAFILVIVGFKSTSKGMKITSLIVSILSLVIVLLVTIFMFVFSLEITLENGYRTTIGDYFKSAFLSGYNSDEIEGYWISQDNELFYLDDDEYYLYMDSSSLKNNYFSGDYTLDYGYDLKDDTIFEDDDYYYYTIETSNGYRDLVGTRADSISELLEGKIRIKIDKENFKFMVLQFLEEDIELQLTRY